VPLSSDFKQTMLANGHVSKRILSRFESISPNPERLSSLAKALDLEKTQETADKAIAAKTESNAKTDDASAPILATSTPTAPIISSAATTISTSASIGATSSVFALSKVNKQDQITPANNSTTKTPSNPTTQIASIPKTTQGISEELFEGDDIFNDDNDKDSFSAESLLSEQLYISKLTKWTSQFVKYPRYSVSRNQEGTVRVTVVLARNGKVTDIEITDKSVHDQLNKAAKTAISEASPYPSMPEDLKGDVFRFTVPVVFRLN
jgi:TonB family protein